jgi:hypothetical protein
MSNRPEITLHGHHHRWLTPEETAQLQEMHRQWLAQQGPGVQAAWGYDPAEFEPEG